MTVSMADPEQREVERQAHAIYGLVIITAALVADREFAENALVSLLALWGAALVLVLAHTYAALLAEIGQQGHQLSYLQRQVLIADNVPLGAAVLLPTALLVASSLRVLPLEVAIDLSILFSLAALCGLGAFQARRQGASLAQQIKIGILGGAMGVAVVTAEVLLAH
jgi:hypothetical protein